VKMQTNILEYTQLDSKTCIATVAITPPPPTKPPQAKGIGTGTIIGLGLLGVGVLGAVVYATKEKKYSPPKEYLKYP